MRKSLSIACALGIALAALTIEVQAMPAAPEGASISSSAVTQAGWRCGRHWHWSWRWHRCVRN